MGSLLAPVQRMLRKRAGQRRLRALAQGPIKLVIGASGEVQPGWIETDQEYLDLLLPETWEACFEPESIDAMMAEHVWEHLSLEEGVLAAKTCHRFLAQGGSLRIAVPDGHHPNPDYIEYVRPGGSGPEGKSHRMLYTHQTLVPVFEKAGFRVELLEYFDEAHAFHATSWDDTRGLIRRSARHDTRNMSGELAYTSIILDAVK